VASNAIGTLYDDGGRPLASTTTGRTTSAAMVVAGRADPAAGVAAANLVPVAGMVYNGSTFDPHAGLNGTAYVTSGGSTATPIAVNTSADTVIKASPGRLCRVIVTTLAANPMQIFDNASAGSGALIGALPASPAVGTVYDFQTPAAAGITVKGSATNPAVIVTFV
jgi:hypothetical protein